MANFLSSHRLVMVNEGGWNITAGDRGGETYKGISRNNFHAWSGWLIVDDYKKKFPDTFKPLLDHDQILQGKVLNFYRSNFWNTIQGDQIISQNTADSIYDSAVNMGPETAIKLVQDTAFSLPNQQTAKQGKVKELGIKYGTMDQKTIDALNNIV